MKSLDWNIWNDVCASAVKAGEYQMSKFRSMSPGSGDEKVLRETVSEVDVNSEAMLIESLKDIFPGAGFLGEESGRSGNEESFWIIDPLDGTTNYLSGLDQFSISIAYFHKGEVHGGVVYRPASGETFSAVRGLGFRHNGKESTNVNMDLECGKALIGTGFPYRSEDLHASFFTCAQDVLLASRGMRRFGSAALDLAYVAAGFLQGFWESELMSYDCAAGILMMEEAGRISTNGIGGKYDLFNDRLLVCGVPSVHKKLLSIVKSSYNSLA
ncbi:MAG: inositol monophosphatase [Lentisphaeraceae bacterium]|nr:inositol monophosphatase [Lentisphaeraceae bacterium]